MSLIFYEGFNRSFPGATDPAGYWTVNTSAAYNGVTATPIFGPAGAAGTITSATGAAIGSRTGSGVLHFPRNFNAGTVGGRQAYVSALFTAQPQTTPTFIGFAIDKIWTGYASAATASPYATDFMRFYDSVRGEAMVMRIQRSTGSVIHIYFSNTFYGTYLGPFVLNNAADFNATLTGATYYGTPGDWTYLELNIVWGTTTQVSVRVNGLPLQTTSGATTLTITSMNISGSLAGITMHGCETSGFSIDDFYFLNNAGNSPFNTWLGPKTKIFTPTIAATNTDVTTPALQEWSSVGTLTLDSDSGDSDYLTARAIDKSQLYVLNSSDGLFSIPASESVAFVQVRSSARDLNPAAHKHVFRANSAATSNTVLSNELATTAAYKSFSTLITTNPATSTAWSLNDLKTAHFGVQSVQRTT